MHKLRWWQQAGYQLGLVAIALFVLVPVWGVVYLAFDGGIKGWPTTFRAWPQQPTLDVFVQVWQRPAQSLPFVGLLRNSLIVSAGAALLSVLLGASMAYAFARYRFPGRRLGLFALLLGALLPAVALMVPLYVLLSAIGIRTTLLGLIVVYTSFALPFCIWNMRAAFQSVAVELEESAFLDGASTFTTFTQITLPLALPSIAIAALIAFLIGYSEFAMGWLFVDKAQNVTLAMAISGMIQSPSLESWAKLAALATLMSLPVVLIFLVLQKYLVDRLLVGTVED
jgi:arabinogalactan oligomer / maltooligosaccharide transport system permease protein